MTSPDDALKSAEAKGKLISSPRSFWWRPADVAPTDVTPPTAIYVADGDIFLKRILVVGGPYAPGAGGFVFTKRVPGSTPIDTVSYSTSWSAWEPEEIYNGSVALTKGNVVALEVTKVSVLLPPLMFILELSLPE